MSLHLAECSALRGSGQWQQVSAQSSRNNSPVTTPTSQVGIGLLRDEVDHLMMRDTDKAEMSLIPSLPSPLTPMMGPAALRALC